MTEDEEKIQREKIGLMKLAMALAYVWGTLVLILLTLIAFHGK